jgi:hypothetical protein
MATFDRECKSACCRIAALNGAALARERHHITGWRYLVVKASVTADMDDILFTAAAHLGCRFREIACRSRPELPPEHRDERARAFISQINRNIRHGFTKLFKASGLRSDDSYVS